MKTFYEMVIHPKDNQCPKEWEEEVDCDNCEYRKYIGRLGGEFYVECEHPNAKYE